MRVEIVTPPATLPVSVADLHTHLRLNDASEDAILTDCIGAAVDQFERDTRRPILATTYRQTLDAWPRWVALGRGGVTAVTACVYLDAAGAEIAVEGYSAQLRLNPARVLIPTTPPVLTECGAAVGHVDFVAGWANAEAVPKSVRVAIKLLAAHYYANREAHAAGTLAAIPDGWQRVCDGYRLGLSANWGQ